MEVDLDEDDDGAEEPFVAGVVGLVLVVPLAFFEWADGGVVVEVVALAVGEPTDDRSLEVGDPVDEVAADGGEVTANAVPPPATPIAATDAAAIRDRRVRYQRRRVAGLIKVRRMSTHHRVAG